MIEDHITVEHSCGTTSVVYRNGSVELHCDCLDSAYNAKMHQIMLNNIVGALCQRKVPGWQLMLIEDELRLKRARNARSRGQLVRRMKSKYAEILEFLPSIGYGTMTRALS
jgi:hypothetical protein